MFQQSRDPLTILDVGLPSGHRLYVLRVDEQQLEGALQDLLDRPPVDPGALHWARELHRHRLLVSAPPRRRNRLFRVSSTCYLRGRGATV